MNVPPFELWLEFEHYAPDPDEDPSDDFANVQVRLADGRCYAMNVWTFKFLHRARFPSLNDVTDTLPAEYVVAPDLFVVRLDRETMERVISALLLKDEMKPEWLCRSDTSEAGGVLPREA